MLACTGFNAEAAAANLAEYRIERERILPHYHHVTTPRTPPTPTSTIPWVGENTSTLLDASDWNTATDPAVKLEKIGSVIVQFSGSDE